MPIVVLDTGSKYDKLAYRELFILSVSVNVHLQTRSLKFS